MSLSSGYCCWPPQQSQFLLWGNKLVSLSKHVPSQRRSIAERLQQTERGPVPLMCTPSLASQLRAHHIHRDLSPALVMTPTSFSWKRWTYRIITPHLFLEAVLHHVTSAFAYLRKWCVWLITDWQPEGACHWFIAFYSHCHILWIWQCRNLKPACVSCSVNCTNLTWNAESDLWSVSS